MNKIHLSVQLLLFTVFLSSCNAVTKFVGKKGCSKGITSVTKIIKPALFKPFVHFASAHPSALISDEVWAIATKQEREALTRCLSRTETAHDILLLQKSKLPIARTYNLITAWREEECLIPRKTKVSLTNTNGNGAKEVKLLENIIDNTQYEALNKGIKRFNIKANAHQGLSEVGIAERERYYNESLKEALTDIEFIKTYSLNPATGIVTMTIAVSESKKATFEVQVQMVTIDPYF
jgi:hypothetical protein